MREAPQTVAAMLLARAGDDQDGLRFEGDRWSWHAIVEAAAARAALLRAELDRARPPHVGVLSENSPEFLFLYGGAALAGAVIVGLNPTRRGAELARDVTHTDCQLVIVDDTGAALLDGLDLGGARVLRVGGDEHRALVDAHRDAPIPSELPPPEALYVLLFTSGSTGAPKAVKMSQGRAARTAASSIFTPDDVLYCAMPLFHGNALAACVFPAMRTGATIALAPRFSASQFLPDLRRHGATFFNTVGRALGYVLATPERADDREHSVKWALGPEASPGDIRAFRKRFGVPIIEGYGSSENAIILEPQPGMPKGALGKPQAGADVRVVHPDSGEECAIARFDDEGRFLNAEEAIGELVSTNTASRFEGYYNNPEAEAERVRRPPGREAQPSGGGEPGWYWSGDLAYRDADGWLWFAGRSSDWLRVDAENFAAAPIERILGRFPGVAAVAVYGVPDAKAGDQVMVAIEMEPGAAFDVAAFEAFLDAQPDLGTKWAPRYVRVTSRIPVTGTNKIAKVPLRAARWDVDEPIWWRPPRAAHYVRFTAADAAALHDEFAANGRAHLIERAP